MGVGKMSLDVQILQEIQYCLNHMLQLCREVRYLFYCSKVGITPNLMFFKMFTKCKDYLHNRGFKDSKSDSQKLLPKIQMFNEITLKK